MCLCMLKKYFYILFLLCFISLVACGKTEKNDNKQIKEDWLPNIENSNQILLYDRFDQRILTYDTTKFSVIKKIILLIIFNLNLMNLF